VHRGNLYVLPIGNSLSYVQPIYLASAQEQQALPELRRVIVVIGTNIGFQPTFQAALAQAIGGQVPTAPDLTGAPPPPTTTSSTTVKSLLDQAIQHFNNADAALRRGDLATYQSENQAGRAAVEQAQRGG
jgi:uncharacterized membrane protein (UPF0182 family)